MAWWGKVVGGAFGFMLGGPLGAAFGAAIGHSFDKGLAQDRFATGSRASSRERIQAAFFTATFSVMGHIVKADGRVTEDEIALASAVMRDMALNKAQTRVARKLFNQGKQADFDLDGVVEQFRRECHRRQTLMQMFIEIQLHAAYADGSLHPHEAAVLEHLASRLGFSERHFEQLEALVRAQRHRDGGRSRPRQAALTAVEAYAILGVAPSANDGEIKKAYRRLMSQHHPDKLVAKGLPEEMMKVATAKTQEIKAAYDAVKAARGGTLK
jgi:DnaJ like chaperone protein